MSIAVRKAHEHEKFRRSDILRDLIIKNNAFQFIQQINGSPAYWQHIQYELLALVRSKGIFIWFLTLSCADTHWPETIRAIALLHGIHLSDDDVINMSSSDRHEWLRNNPTMAARQFNQIVSIF